jgi:hypothetical protein
MSWTDKFSSMKTLMRLSFQTFVLMCNKWTLRPTQYVKLRIKFLCTPEEISHTNFQHRVANERQGTGSLTFAITCVSELPCLQFCIRANFTFGQRPSSWRELKLSYGSMPNDSRILCRSLYQAIILSKYGNFGLFMAREWNSADFVCNETGQCWWC